MQWDEPTNEDRRQRAAAALEHYALLRGEVYEGRTSECADLVADLMHLAEHMHDEDAREATAYKMCELAAMHFDAEHGNPEEEKAA